MLQISNTMKKGLFVIVFLISCVFANAQSGYIFPQFLLVVKQYFMTQY